MPAVTVSVNSHPIKIQLRNEEDFRTFLQVLIDRNYHSDNLSDFHDPEILAIKQYLYNCIDFGVNLSDSIKNKIIDGCIQKATKQNIPPSRFKNLLKIDLKALNDNKYKVVFLISTNRKVIDPIIPSKISDIEINYYDLNKCKFRDFLYSKFYFFINQFPQGIFLSIDNKKIAIPKSDFVQLNFDLVNYDSDSAILESLRIIDLLRFCLNFPFSQSLINSSGIGYREISEFQQSPLYILFKENNQEPKIFINKQKCKYSRGGALSISNYEKKCKSYLKLINNFFKSIDSSYFLSICLTYQNALDNIDPNISYLYFWQTLEVITLHTKDSRSNRIISRVKKLLNLDQTRVLFTAVESLDIPRHAYVHSGIDIPIKNISIFFLKYIVEQCMTRVFDLYNNGIISNSSDLDYFYEIYSKNNKDLEKEKTHKNRLKIITYIQKQRK